MGKVTDQQLIDQVDRPEDKMDEQQDDGVVIIPAYHEGIDTQNGIYNAGISVVHGGRL